MTNNDETRSWKQLAIDNAYKDEQLEQARITIANLQQANKVAAQIDGVQLKSADRAQVEATEAWEAQRAGKAPMGKLVSVLGGWRIVADDSPCKPS